MCARIKKGRTNNDKAHLYFTSIQLIMLIIKAFVTLFHFWGIIILAKLIIISE